MIELPERVGVSEPVSTPLHAVARCAERYSMAITPSDLDELARRTRRGEVGVVDKLTGGGVECEAMLSGTDCRSGLIVSRLVRYVYVPAIRRVVTFLPPRTAKTLSLQFAAFGRAKQGGSGGGRNRARNCEKARNNPAKKQRARENREESETE